VYIFEHLGLPDWATISFVGEKHGKIYDVDPIERGQHFATAFFGYYLQGRDDSAEYFSEQFVALHGDLAWRVYAGE
jgi:hypothetical protein